MTQEPDCPPFEIAFSRLEKILEQINAGHVSLDDALKLYEEADALIGLCSRRLSQAEQKIEVLMKNRQGELTLDAEGNPEVQRLVQEQS